MDLGSYPTIKRRLKFIDATLICVADEFGIIVLAKCLRIDEQMIEYNYIQFNNAENLSG